MMNTEYQPVNSLQVVAFIVKFCKANDIPLNITKLQKLMYCCYGVVLAKTGLRLTDEHPEAWQYGPVFPDALKCVQFFDLEEFEEVRRRLESAELEEVLSRDVLGVDVWVREVLEALLKADFGDSEISYSYGADIGLRCSCSEEKMASALKLLSPEELEAAWSGRDELTLQCQFCGRRYTLRRR